MATLLQIKEAPVTLQSELNSEGAKELLQEMKDKLEETNKELAKLKSEVKTQNEEISKLKLKLEEKETKREIELAELKSEVKTQNEEISKLKLKLEEKETKRDIEPVLVMDDAPTSSILLSNVTLTDVCRHLETDVKVTCLPDATLEDLQATISKDDKRYKNIYLITGNSGCVSELDTDGKKQYEELLKAAKNKCKQITIASVLPILEDEDLNKKIKEINTVLEGVCQKSGCVFVDNDRTFKYQDGTTVEGCFNEEGESLSEFGIKRLLKNLGLLVLKKKTQAKNI